MSFLHFTISGDNGENYRERSQYLLCQIALYLSQPGKSDIISVDFRPSDAINVANICKASMIKMIRSKSKFVCILVMDGCYQGKVKEALHFHDHVLAHGFHLDQVSYGTLINGLCKIGETRAALQVLRQIEGKLVEPNVGLFDEVETLLSKMEDNGIIHNAITYKTMICALFHKDENEKAENLLREMISRGSSIISNGGEVKACWSVVKLQRSFSCPYSCSGRLAYVGKAYYKGVNSQRKALSVGAELQG
ncbi:hypothetical protein TSUD_370530 [Trifolium subterraneum]|uniref:Pentatricopeptide repeat-containing protein n=1 Tax=Trifolium subterraneum TaxID=3900 RepID=A0A2Z6MFU9_TRISU|nr:hypothetical protein TSUD_370530 [Trifolium subterraneum]